MPTAAERTATLFNALPSGRGDTPILEWEQDSVTFRVFDAYVHESENGFRVMVEAEDINGLLPVDDEYGFFNPPTGIVMGWYGDGTPVIDNSDPQAVVQIIIAEAVLAYATDRGWQP